MSKNIVVCCDGTWNEPTQEDNGIPAPTNIWRLFNALPEVAGEQVTRYQAGVGTGGLIDKLTGGIFGAGISVDIMDTYYYLCDKYSAGDRIFLFGFSRGAFCARSLAGLVNRFGLLDLSKVTSAKVKSDFVKHVYKKGYQDDWPVEKLKKYAKGLSFVENSKKIHFIGVFDTVGALGVPDDKVIADIFDDPQRYQFHNVHLSPEVKNARQALSIDEERSSFTPTLWKPESGDNTFDERVKQVWFPGVHSDIGGGYKETGLANCALHWMYSEAVTCSEQNNGTPLQFNENFLTDNPENACDVLHQSHKGLMKVIIPRPRAIPEFRKDNPNLSEAAWKRHCAKNLHQGLYHPNLPFSDGEVVKDIYARHPWYWTGIYLKANVTYKITASGMWHDSSIIADAGGTKNGRFQPGEFVHVLASIQDGLESIWKRLPSKSKADFYGSRRHPESEWMCLRGCIANELKTNVDGTPEQHEHFEIGESTTITPISSGYLYCFANDAWGFYKNNRGYVSMKVVDSDYQSASDT